MLGIGCLAGLSALLGLEVGWVPAMSVLGLLVLVYVVLTAIVRRDQRRSDGGARRGPSRRPAQLPVPTAWLLGAKAPGRHARRSDEVGELLGRLSLSGAGMRWDPREGDRERGVGPVVFDRPWAAEVVRLWGRVTRAA